MRLRTITLEGFQSYRNAQTVDLEGRDLVAIIGPVHSGKTSIVDAMRFALFGSSRGASVTDVIHRGTSLAKVTLVFETTGAVYRIVRTRTRGGRHEVMFSVADQGSPSGWRELCEKNPNAADPAIVGVLGMDEETSNLTWLVRQNSYGAFCGLTPTARRTALAAAFNLDRYTVLADKADAARRLTEDELKKVAWTLENHRNALAISEQELASSGNPDELNTQAVGLSAELDDLNRQLARLDTEGPEQAAKELNALREKHASDLAAYRRRRQTLTAQAERSREALGRARVRVDAAQKAASSLLAARDSIDSAQSGIDEQEGLVASFEERAAKVDAKLRELHRNLDALEQSIADRREQLERLESSDSDGRCITCESPLDHARSEALADQVRATIAEHEARLSEVASRIDTGNDRAKSFRDQRRNAVDRVRTLTAALTDLKADLARLTAQADSLTDAEASAAEAAATLTEAESELEALVEPALDDSRVAALERAANTVVADVESRWEQARNELSQLQARIAVSRNAQAAIDTVQGRIAAAEQSVTTLTGRLDTITVVRDAFRPSGIPSMILAGVVAELNDEANGVMRSTDDDGLGVAVSMTRTTQKGFTESVMVYATTADGNQVEYSTLSGSEQFRVALAVRLGLARCIARRTGTPVQTVVLDEGWGNLDEPTRKGVAAVLGRIAGDFGVLTISHIEDVRDGFEHLITVDCSTGTSVVEQS